MLNKILLTSLEWNGDNEASSHTINYFKSKLVHFYVWELD